MLQACEARGVSSAGIPFNVTSLAANSSVRANGAVLLFGAGHGFAQHALNRPHADAEAVGDLTLPMPSTRAARIAASVSAGTGGRPSRFTTVLPSVRPCTVVPTYR
jgi:hypothetical protein